MASADQKRIALWAFPRSLSSAFCRAMYSRDSCKVRVCDGVCVCERDGCVYACEREREMHVDSQQECGVCVFITDLFAMHCPG